MRGAISLSLLIGCLGLFVACGTGFESKPKLIGSGHVLSAGIPTGLIDIESANKSTNADELTAGTYSILNFRIRHGQQLIEFTTVHSNATEFTAPVVASNGVNYSIRAACSDSSCQNAAAIVTADGGRDQRQQMATFFQFYGSNPSPVNYYSTRDGGFQSASQALQSMRQVMDQYPNP